jgi:poly(hydroxyalkanoate) depolymerase family esterase
MSSLRYRNILAAIHLARAGDLVRAGRILRHALRSTKSARSVKSPPDEKAKGNFLSLSFHNEAGTRAYKVYIPSSYHGRPSPLVVMLHGCTQSPDDLAAGTRMNALADELTFLVAYPEQPVMANLLKCWTWYNRRDQQRDHGEPSLVAGITRQVMKDYAVDPRRVYVAGVSAGGGAAAILGEVYPDVYAAVGVHSGIACGVGHDALSGLAAMKTGHAGGLLAHIAELGAEHRPVPTIAFQGDRDKTVNPLNADHFSAAIAAAENKKQVHAGDVRGGHSYTQTTFADAGGHIVLEQWMIHGEGHAWSGGSTAGSYTDPQGPDATWEFVRFFLSYRNSNVGIPKNAVVDDPARPAQLDVTLEKSA